MVHENCFEISEENQYDLKLLRKVLWYLRWRKIQGMPHATAYDIKTDLGIKCMRQVYTLLLKLEQDGLIRRYFKNKKKFCAITQVGDELLFRTVQIGIPPEKLGTFRELWLLSS